MSETWLAVPEHESRYEVSDLGRVRSLRFRGRDRTEIINTCPNWSGYIVVSLDRKQYRLHLVVLRAFIGPCPFGMEGCHGDNNKSNNRLDNLRWDTKQGNMTDRRSYVGEDNPRAKITNIQKLEIIELVKAGAHKKYVADIFGLSHTRVNQIMHEASV